MGMGDKKKGKVEAIGRDKGQTQEDKGVMVRRAAVWELEAKAILVLGASTYIVYYIKKKKKISVT